MRCRGSTMASSRQLQVQLVMPEEQAAENAGGARHGPCVVADLPRDSFGGSRLPPPGAAATTLVGIGKSRCDGAGSRRNELDGRIGRRRMGHRFDRWLARPSTLHFLRQLLAADRIPATTWTARQSRHHGRRRVATAAFAGEDGGHRDPHPPPPVRKCPPVTPATTRQAAAALLLGSSVQEYGLRMSLKSGVNLISPDLAKHSSLAELRLQADVNNETRDSTLLVHRPEHRENWRLWLEIFRLRQRLDGRAGGIEVWRGIRRRGLVLPNEGADADALWKALVECAAGLDDEAVAIRRDMIDYAKAIRLAHARLYPQMCQGIFAPLAILDTRAAARWFEQCLTNKLLDLDTAVRSLVSDVLTIPSTRANSAFRLFKSMYKKSTSERKLYDLVIPQALRHYGLQAAGRWHELLLLHRDAPSTEVFNCADIQQLFDAHADQGLPMLHAKSQGNAQSSSAALSPTIPASRVPTLSRSAMSSILGEVHGIKPKELSDSFVAKMFATRAFSLELVLRGLSFFGIDCIGPLALREMAVRSRSPVDFGNRLTHLRNSGISVEECIYSRLLTRIIAEGDAQLFDALVASDQHPESYEDISTQEALLAAFLRSGQHAQVQLTTLVLALYGKQIETKALNYLTQHYLSRRSWKLARHTLDLLRSRRMPVRVTTTMYMRDHLLPKRRPGKAPVHQRNDAPPFDALRFTTNMMKYAAEQAFEERRARFFSYPWLWRELLKRHGKTGRWEELKMLVWWLVKHTVHRHRRRVRVGGRKTLVTIADVGPLKEVLNAQMLHGLFVWGFRKAMNWPASAWYVPSNTIPMTLSHLGEARSTAPESEPAWHHPPGTREEESHFHSGTQLAPPASASEWHQGLRLLRQLKDAGIPVNALHVRQAFTMRMWILFGPGTSTVKINEAIRRSNRWPLEHFVRKAQRVWRDDDLFSTDVRIALDAGDEAALMRALFGPAKKMRARGGRERWEWVDVSGWTTESKGKPAPYRPHKLSSRLWLWQKSPFRLEQRPDSKSEPLTTARTSCEGASPSSATMETDTRAASHPGPSLATLTPQEQHRQPSAHSPSSHPAPNPPSTPAPSSPDFHFPPPGLQGSRTLAQPPSTPSRPAPAD